MASPSCPPALRRGLQHAKYAQWDEATIDAFWAYCCRPHGNPTYAQFVQATRHLQRESERTTNPDTLIRAWGRFADRAFTPVFVLTTLEALCLEGLVDRSISNGMIDSYLPNVTCVGGWKWSY